MRSFDWTSRDDEILINFVRQHECLYNPKDKDFRKPQLKLNLWHEIGHALNKTDSDCSKRWSYIRDYYIRRRGKAGTCSSGEAARNRSDRLAFLDDIPPTRKNRSTTIIDESQTDESVTMEDTHDTSEGIPSITHVVGDFRCINTEDDNDEQDNCVNKPIKIKRDKKRKNMSQTLARLSLLKQIVKRNTAQKDETDLFFSSMAQIVKKLPRHEQAQLRMQIGSLVGNAELRHISNYQSSAVSPKPSSLKITTTKRKT